MIHGIQCENTRRIVHRALDGGWLFDGVTRGGHGQLRWQPDGVEPQLLFFGMTPGDRNAWKKLARDIERVSGVAVWQRVKHGRGRRGALTSAESERVRRDRERAEVALEARAGARRRALAAEKMRIRSAQVAAANDERSRFASSGPKPDGRSNPAGAFGRDWAVIIVSVRLADDQDWPAHWLGPAPAESEDAA